MYGDVVFDDARVLMFGRPNWSSGTMMIVVHTAYLFGKDLVPGLEILPISRTFLTCTAAKSRLGRIFARTRRQHHYYMGLKRL